MRKFFSFRSSSASSNANNHSEASAPNNENVYWETPCENSLKIAVGVEAQNRSQTSKDSASSRLRRSLSFSSPAVCSSGFGGNLNSLSDLSGSPSSFSDAPHQAAEGSIHRLPLTPERLPRSRRRDHATVRKTHAFEKLGSPSSSRGHQGSSGNSPYSSPVPLKCRSARLTQISNKDKILDLYIDGEQQERKSNKESLGHSPCKVNDGFPPEKKMLPILGRPPRAQSSAPASPTLHSKENLSSYSFREDRDIHHHLSTLDWTGDETRPASPQKFAKKTIERQSHPLPGKSKVKQENDSETTTTIGDIYEDSSNLHYSFNSKCASDHTPVYETVNGYCSEETLGCYKHSRFLGDGPMGIKHEISLSSGPQGEDTDRVLLRKVKEAEDRMQLLSENDFDSEKLRNGSLPVSKLVLMIRDITQDRRNLASELSSQLHCRIAERYSAKEALKQAKVDLDSRTRRLEKEKNELQSSLEKELDRRSSDWSFKLEKFQAEEQRLRERVRELAEQNVSLQREVSSLNGRDTEARSRIMNSEMQSNDLMMRLEEVRNENDNLNRVLLELQDRCNGAEADRDCIKRSYKEKEKEDKDLHKSVVRLQRICSEQEKTIIGLRQGYSDEIAKQSSERDDLLTKLQIEQVRLTGVEQTLRREAESQRLEVESLKRENIRLLDRLQCTGSRWGFHLLRLDQELHAQVNCLQNQGLSLLKDSSDFCGKLLELAKRKQHEHGEEYDIEFNGYAFMEYNLKFQSLRGAGENLKRSLQTISKTLDEKSTLEALECQSETTEGVMPRKCKSKASEDELEHELKAETLLTRVLREKLCYNEFEIEQLQAELASSLGGHEILRSGIQKLQDDLSCLTHKANNMELQMLRKGENFKQLQCDLQECTKELNTSRGVLSKVSVERDHLWEEVKQLKETNMLLDYEVKTLKKKIEVLDEDILIKEGQITILKDSLGNKPFDILYSPSSRREFALE